MLKVVNHQRNANQNPMRYHLTPFKMALNEKTTNNTCWQGSGEKGTVVHSWWECKSVQPLWKNSMEVPQKTKNKTSI